MFEKEAKEWVKENTRIVEHSASFGDIKVEPSAEKGFQKGAEFGYNKANEWHYPSKGEYPNNENDILCQISKDEVVVGYYHTTAKRYISIDGLDLYKVYAWKEIVFPELPKESE